LCENTLALDGTKDPYPCFVINDLSQDDRFASLPVVNGQLAAYRFYAGTPITTSHGINIGSLFVFDDRPRRGLSLKERSFLWLQARNVMRHLETKREAAERRRAALMSKGISDFLERASRVVEEPLSIEPSVAGAQDERFDNARPAPDIRMTDTSGTAVALRSSQRGNDSVLDKIRLTLNHAAEVLRESLELKVGGVVFLDTAIGYTDTGDMDVATVDEIGEGREDGLLEADGSRLSLSRHNDKIGRHLSRQSGRSSADKHKPAVSYSGSRACFSNCFMIYGFRITSQRENPF
jgi:hypothetical protein